jgi:alpha-1,6-mannosyltransferase
LAIYLFVLAGVIFRSELALLLATQLFYLLIQPRISLQTIIPAGLRSAAIALAISVPIDSYFWQRPIWPELAGFFYNAIQGKSSDWGTSPFHAYFTNFLPKLLLNPAIQLLLIPASMCFPATRRAAYRLLVPSVCYIAIYSLQPHKEARFIIYAVPPLTACAALGANYIFTRRARSLVNSCLSLAIILSIIGSFAASVVMLGISSLNYPGGEALFRLHEIVANTDSTPRRVHVHMDVLACMTGVSRFQQDFPSPPLSHYVSSLLLASNKTSSEPSKTLSPVVYRYDKTEDPTTLLDPAFWTRFDYVLAERPETVIGSWEIVDTIYGFAGIEFLRPGAVSTSGVDNSHNAGRVWEAMGGKSEEGEDGTGSRDLEDGDTTVDQHEFSGTVRKLGLYGYVREWTRKWVTKGWWFGPKTEAKIRILRRIP